MKFTLPWLKDHLDTDADPDRLAAALTALGLEVEGVSDPAADLHAFTIAYVKDAVQHPNADRLRVCTVETKDGVKQVVCGAPNARAGMKAVFAPEGAYVPGTGITLKRSRIRDVESEGMLCSMRELMLGDEHDGIVDYRGDAPVGAPAASALGVEGPVFDVAITPDRADCLGVLGIARDLAAGGVGRLKDVAVDPVPAMGRNGPAIRLDFPEGEEAACPVFVGRLIRGVRNGPSPAWMQRRLRAVGLRPISALVDVTNYVMLDLDRPLHVFDAAKLTGDLALRFAREGEELLALDGRTYGLTPEMTVIADEDGPQSLGGIMGGEDTGVTAETTDVLLEVALFDPIRTAMTGRTLGIDSDARARFERGLDPLMVLPGMEAATRLILELCGGEAQEPVVAGRVPESSRTVHFPLAELPRLGGIDLERAEIDAILGRLGFAVVGEGEGAIELRVPSWRGDVTDAACIVEELCRVHGYDRIPPVPLTRLAAVTPPVLTLEQRRRGHIRRTVADQGLLEAVTFSFTGEATAGPFTNGPLVRLLNPISSELSVMRPSLLPNLLWAAAGSFAKRREGGALFELGPRFTGSRPGDQVWALAGLRFGGMVERGWAEPARPVDAFDAKADALAALQAAGVRVEAVGVTAEAPPWYHPGRSGRLGLGPQTLATFGELHPKVIEAFDLPVSVVAFEIDLDALPKPKAKAKGRSPLERWPHPPVDRDFAFLVDAAVPAADVLKAARGADKRLIRDVALFDAYAGKGVPEGKRSLAFSVRLQAKDRTLTDADVEPVAQRIVQAVEKQTGGVLRG
ncbi:MAG: phenylalanine--tRNA ligase subunit beta [Geminicoccaceae bacterium]|nr:phenylalanine--tRNA ligase subunit beta [Geminicoccaceae bacterium]